MAYEGLMAQLANPRVADVAGAMDYREQKMQAQKERERQETVRALMAKAITGLKEGSDLRRLADQDPETFINFAKVMGIPPNDGARLQQLSDDVYTLSDIAQQDPTQAISYAQQLKDQRAGMGLETPELDRFLVAAQEDPNKAIKTTLILNQSLNRGRIAEQELANREMALKERGLDIKEKGLDMGVSGGQPLATEVLVTPNGVVRVNRDPRVPAAQAVEQLSLDGKPIQSYMTDPNLKERLSGASEKGKGEAKSVVDYKNELFKSIGSNTRLVDRLDFAIEQLDKGAQTGVIYNKLPNIQEASILVDVVRKEIGMEVLGSGLLGVNPTDRDVDFALTTAIPDSLSPEALKRELSRRSKTLKELIVAQNRYYDLLDEGYSKGDILRLARKEREARDQKPDQKTDQKADKKMSREEMDAYLNGLGG